MARPSEASKVPRVAFLCAATLAVIALIWPIRARMAHGSYATAGGHPLTYWSTRTNLQGDASWRIPTLLFLIYWARNEAVPIDTPVELTFQSESKSTTSTASDNAAHSQLELTSSGGLEPQNIMGAIMDSDGRLKITIFGAPLPLSFTAESITRPVKIDSSYVQYAVDADDHLVQITRLANGKISLRFEQAGKQYSVVPRGDSGYLLRWQNKMDADLVPESKGGNDAAATGVGQCRKYCKSGANCIAFEDSENALSSAVQAAFRILIVPSPDIPFNAETLDLYVQRRHFLEEVFWNTFRKVADVVAPCALWSGSTSCNKVVSELRSDIATGAHWWGVFAHRPNTSSDLPLIEEVETPIQVALTEQDAWLAARLLNGGASSAFVESRVPGISQLRDLKAKYAADVVVYLASKRAGALCGQSSSIGRDDYPHFFSVVGLDADCSDTGLAHEVGHLLGARHEYYFDQSGEKARHALTWFDSGKTGKRWSDLMSRGLGTTRVPYFSSDDATCDGYPLGLSGIANTAKDISLQPYPPDPPVIDASCRALNGILDDYVRKKTASIHFETEASDLPRCGNKGYLKGSRDSRCAMEVENKGQVDSLIDCLDFEKKPCALWKGKNDFVGAILLEGYTDASSNKFGSQNFRLAYDRAIAAKEAIGAAYAQRFGVRLADRPIRYFECIYGPEHNVSDSADAARRVDVSFLNWALTSDDTDE